MHSQCFVKIVLYLFIVYLNCPDVLCRRIFNYNRKLLAAIVTKTNSSTIEETKSHIPLGLKSPKVLGEYIEGIKLDSSYSGNDDTNAVDVEEDFKTKSTDSSFSIVTPEMTGCDEETDDTYENGMNDLVHPVRESDQKKEENNAREDDDDDDEEEAHDLLQADEVLKDLYESITAAESMSEIFSLLEEVTPSPMYHNYCNACIYFDRFLPSRRAWILR